MGLKLQRSHLTCQVANKHLNNTEKLKVVDRNKDGLLPTPAVQQISVSEKKSQVQKKNNSKQF